MDDKDRNILEILNEDGRASYTEIAEQLGVSEATVRNRVQKLRENGTIEKFTVETSDNQVSAILLAKISTGKNPEKVIDGLPGGLEVYEVTGEHDLVISIEGQDRESLNESIDDIRGIEGIKETVTKSVLKERKT